MSKYPPFDTAFNNDGQSPLRVPGFGLPIEYWPHADGDKAGFSEAEVRFRHGTNDFRGERLTVKEVSMLAFMNVVTDKQDWNKKVFDDQIVAKWKQEAMASDQMMSDKAFEWCVTELKDKAKQYEEVKFVLVLDSESACIKSDVVIDHELREDLKAAVEPLMKTPNPDWHPGSNEQVLNLVHPSLYPLVYGKTRVLTSGTVELSDIYKHVGHGEVAGPEQEINDFSQVKGYRVEVYTDQIHNKHLWSNRFQWLPAEIKFRGSHGTDVEIVSYINNLHPVQHKQLYEVVERMISKSIPLWNEVLIRGLYGRYPERIKTFGTVFEEDVPEWCEYDMEDNEENRQKVREYLARPNNPDADEDWDEPIPDDWETNPEVQEEWSFDRLVDAKWRLSRRVVHPEPGVAFTYDEWKAGEVDKAVVKGGVDELIKHTFYQVKLEETFRERGLQVIVKLAGIELTPEKPEYSGGSWHLEGMLNEHIVATAIYYYDVENTTDARLRFRQEDIFHETEVYYEQNDHGPIQEIFDPGEGDFSTGVSELGSISTPQGRLLVFPNTLQHAVSGFKLADATKPGHRRFIVLWLVDPHLRIMSTANVPPQQHDWWAPSAAQNAGINNLPAEVTRMIMENTKDWPMGEEEAKALRLELMAERTAFGQTVESNFMEYNLCEH